MIYTISPDESSEVYEITVNVWISHGLFFKMRKEFLLPDNHGSQNSKESML